MGSLMSTYQGFLINVALMACVVVPSPGQDQSNPKVPQSQRWCYEQFTDKLTEKPLQRARLREDDGHSLAVVAKGWRNN